MKSKSPIPRTIFAFATAILLAIAGPSIAAAQSSSQPSGQAPAGDRADPGTEHPNQSAPRYWGAIAFTADGSWATAWKMPTKAEAEAKVAVDCAKLGRGSCEVIGFRGEICVGLATYLGAHSGKRWRLSFTAGGTTTPEAQQASLARCNNDPRTRGRCQFRTVICGDGR